MSMPKTDPIEWENLAHSELVDRALNADSQADRESAFSAIFPRHHHSVLAFCGGRLQAPHRAADAAAETFIAAFTTLASLKDTDNLRGWLFGIARNQCHTQEKNTRRQIPLPAIDARDEDELRSYEKASRARHAEVDRLLDVVVATLTKQEQKLFQLTVRDGIVGAQLAKALAVKPEEASRRTWDIITTAHEGFGALVLARSGRWYCPVLAGILDQYAWNGENFTRKLRRRIIRHLERCLTCDNCAKCSVQRERLLRPLAPALIPILVIQIVRDRAGVAGRKQAQRGNRASTKKRAGAGAGGAGLAFALILRLLLTHHYHQSPPTAGQVTMSVWVQPGSGWTVNSSPPGLTCAGFCHLAFASGTPVTLTSNYQPTSIPLKWVGCDNATNSAADPCIVTAAIGRAICIAPYDPPITVMTPQDCAARAAG